MGNEAMTETYDAIVIGAGIIGASVAFELAKSGRRTICIDRLPAAGYGSTGNSCAIVRLHYSTFQGTALAREAYFGWKEWEKYVGQHDERGLAKFLETGIMVLKTAQNNDCKAICKHLDALEIPWQNWDIETIRKKLPIHDWQRFAPAKRLDDEDFGQPTGGEISGAIFYSDAGYVDDPQLATHNIQRAAENFGAVFRFNSTIVEVLRDGNQVSGVALEDGTLIKASIVVNVAGPHSSKINAMADVLDGMAIKTRALRQEVCHLPSPQGFDFEKSGFIISDGDISCYCRPAIGNNILVGSEDPDCDILEYVDPDDYNTNFSEQWTTQARRAGQRIPALGIPGQAQGIVDLYDASDDWIPIYDRSDLDGFYLAIGTSGNQFKNAPVVGAMMAKLIEKCENGHDHDADPIQFDLQNIGRCIDLGFYSRRREINQESSFSVLG